MKQRRILNKFLLILSVIIGAFSCADFLEVAPEGTANLESAFSMRFHTLRYLYTCYSYLPNHAWVYH